MFAAPMITLAAWFAAQGECLLVDPPPAPPPPRAVIQPIGPPVGVRPWTPPPPPPPKKNG